MASEVALWNLSVIYFYDGKDMLGNLHSVIEKEFF
jgi:hypothetical protein